MATFAHFERRLIGQRTKEALAAKPGSTLAGIAALLNAEQVPTAHGGRQWWPATVRAALAQQHRAIRSSGGGRASFAGGLLGRSTARRALPSPTWRTDR